MCGGEGYVSKGTLVRTHYMHRYPDIDIDTRFTQNKRDCYSQGCGVDPILAESDSDSDLTKSTPTPDRLRLRLRLQLIGSEKHLFGQDPMPFRFTEPVHGRELIGIREEAGLNGRSTLLSDHLSLRVKSFCLHWAKTSHDERQFSDHRAGVGVGKISSTPTPTPTPVKTVDSDRLRLRL